MANANNPAKSARRPEDVPSNRGESMSPGRLRVCAKCHQQFSSTNTSAYCKPCYAEYHREWWQRNVEHNRKRMRDQNRRTRQQAIDHYGGRCACCGESRYEFMAIDHINGDGGEHRRQIGKRGNLIYYWLRKNGYPEGFRVLCHNCNLAMGFYGYCPHDVVVEVQA